ncbi:helix-turn-helix transcriptional regulator [Oceanisphaera pacifica]|uniref:WYL domain-containing protein n=1 Tax=Oceanisphaera pacifica TaxID=2818389 RepID=A0ABS3NEP9_9GAMM|nr:WYL domain-containing protein [Oceanisphaera pacifica]MBO1519010.1 WYL domain-containing protein [Oceanisphaera pacifica]
MEKHLTIIDFYLTFFGRLRRADLMLHGEMSVATASRALSEYREQFPDSINYDARLKTYFAADDFVPAFSHSAQDALNVIAHGTIERFIGELQKADLSTLPTLSSHLALNQAQSLTTISQITKALTLATPLDIHYYSASSESKVRCVYPLAIFEATGTWYFRGYDVDKADFRIFRFSRVLSAKQTKLSVMVPPDKDWQQYVTLTLMPHPKHTHPAALKMDLGLVDKPVCNISTRKALAGFSLRSLRVDASLQGVLSPIEYPLYLANRHELLTLASMAIAPGFNAT